MVERNDGEWKKDIDTGEAAQANQASNIQAKRGEREEVHKHRRTKVVWTGMRDVVLSSLDGSPKKYERRERKRSVRRKKDKKGKGQGEGEKNPEFD